jgi:hypothetical protein
MDQSIRLEMFGDLHEYGALGRGRNQNRGAEGHLTQPASTEVQHHHANHRNQMTVAHLDDR